MIITILMILTILILMILTILTMTIMLIMTIMTILTIMTIMTTVTIMTSLIIVLNINGTQGARATEGTKIYTISTYHANVQPFRTFPPSGPSPPPGLLASRPPGLLPSGTTRLGFSKVHYDFVFCTQNAIWLSIWNRFGTSNHQKAIKTMLWVSFWSLKAVKIRQI